MTPNAEFLGAVYSDTPISDETAVKRKWLPSTICRYCQKSVEKAEAKVVGSYWWAWKAVSHAGCLKAGYYQEAYDCQEIDANCNDCAHFQRTKGNRGCCKEGKKDDEYTVFPGDWQGMPCFVHRKK